MVALEAEAGERHAPALADRAEPQRVGQADVGEEHLVEVGAAAHLLDGPHLDARCVERHQERRHALVLGDVEVVTGDRETPLGEHRAGCPDLLAVEHPFVAVAGGAGGERREVGTGGGLAEQLASPDVLAHERGDEALLLFVGAERSDGGGDEAHRRRRQFTGRGDGEPRLLGEVGAHVRVGQTTAADRDRPVEHRVAGVELESLPLLAREQASLFLGLVEIVEHGDVVAALAPDDARVVLAGVGDVDHGQRLAVRLQPGAGFLAELFQIGEVLGDVGAHGRTPYGRRRWHDEPG